MLSLPASALAQNKAAQAERHALNIPAQPLLEALRLYTRQTGVQVLLASADGAGRRSSAVHGDLDADQALQQLLAGTGLSGQRDANGIITLSPAVKSTDSSGIIKTDTLAVKGNGMATAANQDGLASEHANYRNAGSSTYISQERIQRLRGSSTGDFLSGIPGVMNGDNRSSGSLDVNIRGMQGQGRVPVVIDGALQETTVYRGYSGMAGRSYIDPDLIGGVVIEKGPSAAADATGATGGVVRARTLNAGDLVAPGGTHGVVLRLGMTGNNRSEPTPATVGGNEPAVRNYSRPDLLDLHGKSASLAYGYRSETFDLVAAAVRRETGNYYSGGEDGNGAWDKNLGRFGLEEQIANTSQENHSYLLRGVIRPNQDHTLDLSWMRYDTEHGEMKGSQLLYGDTPYQTNSDIQADTYTARYRFNPDNNLIDLKADLWHTQLDTFVVDPIRLDFGGDIYNMDKYADTLSKRWGLTLSNTSKFYGEESETALSYGLAYDYEDFGKSDDWDELNQRYPDMAWDNLRVGTRRQYSGFIGTNWKPVEWVSLEATMRYLNTETHDDNVGTSWAQDGLKNREKVRGWTPVVSMLIEPWSGIQLYGRYAEAIRAASPFEGTNGFSASTNPHVKLKPEHAHNTEAGLNLQFGNLFADNDLLQAKFGWFDNDVTNYITVGDENLTTSTGRTTNMYVFTNIPRVRMRGIEASLRYDTGWLFSEISTTRYNDITTCLKEAASLNDFCTQGINSKSPSWLSAQLPPRKTLYASAGTRLFDERLTLGVRYSDIERTPAYELFDVYGSYWFNDHLSVDFAVDNVTDRYYVEPLSLGEDVAAIPGPGRTVRISLVSRFGDGEWTRKRSASERAHALSSMLENSPIGPFDGDWTGYHVGTHMGWGLYRAKGNTRSGNGEASSVAASERTNRRHTAIQGGLQFGYDQQTASGLVLGYQIDVDRGRAKGRQNYITPELDNGTFYDTGILQSEYRYRYGWNLSARLRVGQAFGRALIYAFGGVAAIEEEQTRMQMRSNAASEGQPFGVATRPYFSERDNEIRLGFVLGGGIEYAFSNRMSLRGEYLYSRYGEHDFNFDNASRNVNRSYTGSNGNTVVGGVDVPIGRVASNTLEQHSFRIGLNYRF